MNIQIKNLVFYRKDKTKMVELPSLIQTVEYVNVTNRGVLLDKYWKDSGKHVHVADISMNLINNNISGLYIEALVDYEYMKSVSEQYGRSQYQEALNRTFWAIVKYQVANPELLSVSVDEHKKLEMV